MADMMSNPMMQQMLNNPELMKQAASMMGGDPSGMQSMMQNPSIAGMLNNPEFLDNALKMLKDPRNQAMIDMMKQQNPNLNTDMIIKALSGVSKVAACYRSLKNALNNIVVRLVFFGLIVLVIAHYFG